MKVASLISLLTLLFLQTVVFADFEKFEEFEPSDEPLPWTRTLTDYGAANLYSAKARAAAEYRLEKQIAPLKEDCLTSGGLFSEKLVSSKYNQCCINTPSSRPCFRENSYPYPNDKGACTAKLTVQANCAVARDETEISWPTEEDVAPTKFFM